VPIGRLERDDLSSNRHPALSIYLSMIFSENRYPPFRIMLRPSLGRSGIEAANRLFEAMGFRYRFRTAPAA
jgi:hypothetical protein